MASFEKALAFVLENEGGYSDSPADPGGATNHGISLRFLHNIATENLRRYGFFDPITSQTIKDLTIAQAAIVYLGEFWSSSPFDAINSEPLTNYIFDMVVSLGLSQATKLVQRSLTPPLTQDGIFGRVTLAAVNDQASPLLMALPAARSAFYKALVALNPKEEVFLKGWLKRAARI